MSPRVSSPSSISGRSFSGGRPSFSGRSDSGSTSTSSNFSQRNFTQRNFSSTRRDLGDLRGGSLSTTGKPGLPRSFTGGSRYLGDSASLRGKGGDFVSRNFDDARGSQFRRESLKPDLSIRGGDFGRGGDRDGRRDGDGNRSDWNRSDWNRGDWGSGDWGSGDWDRGKYGNWDNNRWNGYGRGDWNRGKYGHNWNNNWGWNNNWWGHNNGWYGYGRRNYSWWYPYGLLSWGFGYPYWGWGWGLGWGGYGYDYPYYGSYGVAYPSTTTYIYADAGDAQVAAPAVDPAAGASQVVDTSEFIALGEQAFRAGQYEQALRDWQHAMVDDPNNGAVVLLMGQALFALGQYESAANTVQMGMQMLPESEWGNVVKNYTQLYGNIEDYTNQIRAAEKVRDSKPDDGALRFLLGYHFGYLNYPKQAVRELDKALDIEPRDVGAQKLRDSFAKAAGIPARAPADVQNPQIPPQVKPNDGAPVTPPPPKAGIRGTDA